MIDFVTDPVTGFELGVGTAIGFESGFASRNRSLYFLGFETGVDSVFATLH